MEAIEKLKQLTGCKYVHLVNRGNTAIKIAFSVLKRLDYHLHIPDQGGWMSYKGIADDFALTVHKLKTNNGLVATIPECEGLILAEPAGYACFQTDPQQIRDHSNFLILDVSGSLGKPQTAQYNADFIIGSFSKWKPVNVGYGGFFATNDKALYELAMSYADEPWLFDPTEKNVFLLQRRLAELPKWYAMVKEHCDQIKLDLAQYSFINPHPEGLIVIVRFKNDEEKQEIIDYCRQKEYEYTVCPREIRVLEDAISIEVKRKTL